MNWKVSKSSVWLKSLPIIPMLIIYKSIQLARQFLNSLSALGSPIFRGYIYLDTRLKCTLGDISDPINYICIYTLSQHQQVTSRLSIKRAFTLSA